jgi:lambda family phage portal protein
MKLTLDFNLSSKKKKIDDKTDRKYEGASKGRRAGGWITGGGDANAQIKSDLPTLRERSRDLRRNNPYAHKIIEVITNNVVGKGIITDVKPDALDDTWKEWAYTTACDYDGRNDLKGLQRLAMDAIVESGEVIIRKRVVAGLKYPLQYQVLESDFIDGSFTKTPFKEGNYVIQGVEFDQDGKRVGYHIYESHPGSYEKVKNTFKSNFIPANEMIHLFKQERPGQVRGIPWMAPSMMRLKDLDDYEDAQLMKQKVAACFTAFVHDIDGSQESDDCSTLEANEQNRITPALIEQLPPGKTITFASPPSVENYREFVSSQLRAISAGVGISYESFSGDLSEVNFSSARMGWLEMGRNIDAWRDSIMLNLFLKEVVSDFKFMMTLLGKPAQAGSSFNHIPPRREMIDPSKEVAALNELVRAGFDSRDAVISSLGRDPDEVYKGLKAGNDKADELGLILDSDPRKVNANGKKHEVSKGAVNE